LRATLIVARNKLRWCKRGIILIVGYIMSKNADKTQHAEKRRMKATKIIEDKHSIERITHTSHSIAFCIFLTT